MSQVTPTQAGGGIEDVELASDIVEGCWLGSVRHYRSVAKRSTIVSQGHAVGIFRRQAMAAFALIQLRIGFLSTDYAPTSGDLYVGRKTTNG